MILADSSAWIELFRSTGSPAHLSLKSALDGGAPLATTDVVMMEILAGARDAADREWLRRLLYSQHFLAVEGPADYETRPSCTVSAGEEGRRRASSSIA